jgi:hypothetical protein
MTLASLLVAAFRDWVAHQRRFWKYTAPAALLLATLPYVMQWGALRLLSPWVESGLRTLFDALVLYQWFKHALYDDWDSRRAQLMRQDGFPWSAFLGVGFLAFWALHFALSYAILTMWGRLVMTYLGMDGTPAPWGVQMTLAPLKELVLAAVFGGFMLFLPARVVRLSWSPLAAFRAAAGVRLRLIVVTVLWAFLSLALLRLLNQLTAYAEDGLDLIGVGERAIIGVDFVSAALGNAMDYLADYMLAYIVAKLFVAATGWRPGPLPA